MKVGIPKEGDVLKGLSERRVGISPAGVREIVSAGSDVFVTASAGAWAGFRDGDYRSAGASVVYSNEETIRRSELVVKVAPPAANEWPFLNKDSTLLSFVHLGVPRPDLLQMLVERRITAIGYEMVQEDDRSLPILRASSQIAGRMAVQLAGHLLENSSGGRGVLLGGVPGIPPADVIILGGGTLGYFAARSFLGMGSSVYILDNDLKRLRELDEIFNGRVVTAIANQTNIEKHVAFADVLIAAVHRAGCPAPTLVRREMVERMNRGSVIIDFSIDQGGCVETSRLNPTQDFLFTSHDVVHFCAPNVPTLVARTATYALTNALSPYLRMILTLGVQRALREERALRCGLYAYGGFASERLPTEEVPKTNLEQLANEME